MSDQQTDESITLFADYVCPFCYLGRQSLDRYQEGRDEELRVDWHPFDLRSNERGPDGEIDPEADSGKDEDYYEQARENVRRLQDEYDVEMAQELITDVDSLNAQVASYYVKEHYDYEQWRVFDDGIYEALWQDGRDIGDADVLAEIAEDADVNPAEVRDALSDENLREDVEALFEHARQRGVTGVPTFAYEGHAARGAVPPEHLERLVEGE